MTPGGWLSRIIRLPRRPGRVRQGESDIITPRQVLTAFTSLPRVLKLVWDVQPVFTLLLALLYVVQGFVPLLTAYAGKLLLNGVFAAIRFHGAHGTGGLVIWFVALQF